MHIVTGGAGFIGSNIVAALAAAEAEVVVCDRFDSTDKWRNIAKSTTSEIIPPESLREFLAAHANQIQSIIHMGAISATTETDVDLIVANNFRLSLDLWSWCAERTVPFIYASSAATYGDGGAGFDDAFTKDALAKLRPLNAYAWSKLAFDRRVEQILRSHAPRPPQWAGLRFFNVYGPNEYHKGSMRSVVAQAYPAAARGEAVSLFRSHHPDYADGGQLRDFIYVKDCVRVVLWLLAHPHVSGLFNVGTGKARSFLDLVSAVFTALDSPPNIQFVDTPIQIRDKYQYFTQAEMKKLREAGYREPFMSLEDGIRDYVERFLALSDPYAGPEDYASIALATPSLGNGVLNRKAG